MLPIKKYIFVDLDNTVYAVKSMGDQLFAPILSLIKNSGKHDATIDAIKLMLTRKPFQYVAQHFNFNDVLTTECLGILQNLTISETLKPFDDYVVLKNIPCKKILVTAGFTILQQSKIQQLGIENDFEAFYIIDHTKAHVTKKDIFETILQQKKLMPHEVLVIGDDANSEIAAAQALGIDAVLINKIDANFIPPQITTVQHFEELLPMFHWQLVDA